MDRKFGLLLMVEWAFVALPALPKQSRRGVSDEGNVLLSCST